MDKKDLLEYSPIRFFDKATKANIKIGEIGLITAKKGLGKTSILVQFGIDTLLQDKALIHVSFDQKSSNVIAWYSSVMAEVCKKKNINIDELNDDIVRNRTILNFNQETFTLPKVVNTLSAMNEGGINLDQVVVDGLDLANIELNDLECFANYIKSKKMTAWFSFTNEATDLDGILSKEKCDIFSTVGHLYADGNTLSLEILKNGEGKVNLDAKTLLFTK